MSEPAIYCENLCKSFGEVRAVTSLSLEIPKGEVYGFLGPNGAGKTTTLKMLCTLISPTAGVGQVAGHDIYTEADKIRLKIGVALQEASLDKILTGRELLTLQGRFYGLKSNQVKTRIEELAPLLEMDAIDRRIGTYSGGMKRRLDVAASLIHNPEVLFLDEPTTGLDPTSRLYMWEEIRRLNQELGVTIFLTTQYLEEADNLAERVAILSDGEIRTSGAPEKLKQQIGKDVICVRIDCKEGEGGTNGNAGTAERKDLLNRLKEISGVTNIEEQQEELVIAVENGAAALSPVAVVLNSSGENVLEISLRTPTLDDVFLEATGNRLVEDLDEDLAEDDTSGRTGSDQQAEPK